MNQRKEEYLWEFFRGTQVPWVLGTELSAIWFNEGKLFIGTKGDGFYILKNPETAPNERKEIKLNWEHYGHVEGLLDVKVIGFARRAVTGREPVYALLHPDGMTFWAGKRDFKPFSFDGRREYTCITSDLEGNVWLGSNGGGVIRITADDKILQYTIGNANFGSNRITAIVSGSDPSQGKGIALWVACDNVKDGSDQVPGLRDGRTIESDIDGSTTHFYDGLAWDKWKIPGIRCFLADGSYLWGGTNIRLRRFYIPNFTDYNK
ncbi:hypothetical protein HYY75_04420 [bacterium]|nr:hypothetical protein [bacterium]